MLCIKSALMGINIRYPLFLPLLYKRFQFFADSKYSSYKQINIKTQQVEKEFVKSSGPGGQNVNKTNSKACIRVKINQCTFIEDYIKKKIKEDCKNQINKEGELLIESQMHRDQQKNLEECYKKLKLIIYKNSLIPKERIVKIPTQTLAEKDKRIGQKKRRSEIKSNRRGDKF